MNRIYIQELNQGGTYGQYNRLTMLSKQSNVISIAAYGLDFLDICENNPERLIELDLQSVECGGLYIPLLLNGSNQYADLSGSKMRIENEIDVNINVEILFIIPENIRLLRAAGSRVGLGLSGALSGRQTVGRTRIIDGLDCSRHHADCLDLVRAFDSHPSTAFYHLCASHIMSQLGYFPNHIEIEMKFVDYRCDLASRFSENNVKCMFVSPKNLHSDLSSSSLRNTGIHHLYLNDLAPIRKKLLLLGDSHSYSALASMMSFAFQQVRFIWASRRDGYGPFENEIELYAKDADHIVEEVSERFFLRNFCVPC